MLLFGSVVGRWIDRSARLRGENFTAILLDRTLAASLTALLINNISVATSAGLLLVLLVVANTPLWLRYVLIYGAIALCGVNMLAGAKTSLCNAQ